MTDPIDRQVLRDCFGTFPVGVTVVTTVDGSGTRWGMTASSFNAISMSPPVVSISLMDGTPSHEAFTTSGEFAISILNAGQVELARKFATRAPDKFEDVRLDDNGYASPVLADAAAWLICKPVDVLPVGDHTLLLGEVIACEARELPALAYQQGRFYALNEQVDGAPLRPRRRGTVAFIIEDESRIALMRDSRYGAWNLPGGSLREGDTIDESLRRTARDIVGADIQPDFLYSVADLNDQLACNIYRGRIEHSPTDALGITWFGETDLPWEELASETLTVILRRYFRERVADQFGVFVGIRGGRIATIDTEADWVPVDDASGTKETRSTDALHQN
jgi:flavin reductase (DIM6/NTAB) family NADH-FMN oxidoreductase RutF